MLGARHPLAMVASQQRQITRLGSLKSDLGLASREHTKKPPLLACFEKKALPQTVNVDNRLKICSAPGGVYRWENLQEKLDFFENFFNLKFQQVCPSFLHGGRWGLARDDSRI